MRETVDEKRKTTAQRAIVTVGEGHGFVLRIGGGRAIVTAAHCLPNLPIAASIVGAEERTYHELLGYIGDPGPRLAVECYFVDPVADIAVLGSPDSQLFGREWEACEALIEAHSALRIGKAPAAGTAWILSLDGEWIKCRVEHYGGPLWIREAAADLVGGMSGSPIVSEDGAAIGVFIAAASTGDGPPRAGGPQPRLTESLPGRYLRRGSR